MRVHGWVAVVLLGTLAAGLRADAAMGKADFVLGQRYQAAKRWGPAAQAYLKTLKDDPQAYWAYKALGTVYYQAGDKRGALAYYDKYLSINPKDTATKNFADSLRATSGGEQAAAGTAAAEPREPSARSHGGFSLRLDGGAVMNDGSDVATLVQGTAQSVLALGGGFGADYALDGGFVAGLDFFYGPNRSYTINFTGTTATLDWSISNMLFQANPGWRFRLARHWLIEPRLGLGYMLSTGTITPSNGGTASTYTASGMEFWPQVRGEYVFGNWGLGGSLGYMIATLSPATWSSGLGSGQNVQTASGSNWAEINGGFSMGLYGAYHFSPPF